jgi:predicted DNA-binding transcriptional regulator AlpA
VRRRRQQFEAAIRQAQRAREPGGLIGVRAICAYLKIGHHTFYCWVRESEFPAARSLGGRWITSKGLIDGWIIARWKARRDEERASRGAEATTDAH